MKIELTEEAREDVLAAAEYYAGARNRYGQTFDEAIEEAALRIPDNPNRGTPFGDRFRRVRLNRFPYGILFTIEGDTVLITAVMHSLRYGCFGFQTFTSSISIPSPVQRKTRFGVGTWKVGWLAFSLMIWSEPSGWI